MKKLVVLSGAGVSAESGLATFRGQDGLWNGYRVEDVATPSAWQANPEMVLDFYNQRRRQLLTVMPNQAHYKLAELEESFEVAIVTQNVDDLHERAGSSDVLHLHGELLKVRGTCDPNTIYECRQDIQWGDLCPRGSQLRPHVVWFGEEVPNLEKAIPIVESADILLIIGTSLLVYPAAGLYQFVGDTVPVYYIDPDPSDALSRVNPGRLHMIKEKAQRGMELVANSLLE